MDVFVWQIHVDGLQTETFLLFIQHFVKHTKCSKEHPVLIVLDNHATHLSTTMINYFCKNCFTVITPIHLTQITAIRQIFL